MPVYVDSGTKVTVPSVFTVYVPWPLIVNVVALQLGTADSSTVGVAESSAPHNFTVVAFSVYPVAALSLERGLMVCVAPCTSIFVLGEAVGAGITVGVIVDDRVRGDE